MSDSLTVSPAPVWTSYRNERAYPFCPGCGHSLIADAVNKALVRLQLDPHRTVIVTDIGCHGLADQYFVTNAFHGLHGRSLAYATGIKLADPGLAVIALIGDGGAGIGGTHLLNAARRNIGITTLVFNNFNFGMTGGEHSSTTLPGGKTATTRGGQIEQPFDLCASVAANGAGFVWRGTAFDRELPDVIADAVAANCFALLDVWELCTAYYVPNNQFSRKALVEARTALGWPAGLVHREERPEYARLQAPAAGEAIRGLRPSALPQGFSSPLDREFRLVIAGAAGGRVRSSARLLGEAAVMSGLWASQADDYPVTVQTGHSISELILSPREILYTGVERPDALVIAGEEGRKQAARMLRAMQAEDIVFVPEEMALPETPATVVPLDTRGIGNRRNLALLMGAAAVQRLNLLPFGALEAAAGRAPAGIAGDNLAVLEQSRALLL